MERCPTLLTWPVRELWPIVNTHVKLGDDNFVIYHVDENDRKPLYNPLYNLDVALRRIVFERSQFTEKSGGFCLRGMDEIITLFTGARDIESGIMNDCQPTLP